MEPNGTNGNEQARPGAIGAETRPIGSEEILVTNCRYRVCHIARAPAPSFSQPFCDFSGFASLCNEAYLHRPDSRHFVAAHPPPHARGLRSVGTRAAFPCAQTRRTSPAPRSLISSSIPSSRPVSARSLYTKITRSPPTSTTKRPFCENLSTPGSRAFAVQVEGRRHLCRVFLTGFPGGDGFRPAGGLDEEQHTGTVAGRSWCWGARRKTSRSALLGLARRLDVFRIGGRLFAWPNAPPVCCRGGAGWAEGAGDGTRRDTRQPGRHIQ